MKNYGSDIESNRPEKCMLTIKRYSPIYSQAWNTFVSHSNNGTLFHRLDFLAYHRQRFCENEHHLLWFKGEQIQAVMPLGFFLENGRKIAKSPFGASYGGIVTTKPPTYSASRELVFTLLEYLTDKGIEEIRITFPIMSCFEKPCETLHFALLEQGFRIVNSDISSLVLLDNENISNNIFTSRARNMAKKAINSGVVSKFRQSPDIFWTLMEQTFAAHRTIPTHSKEEWIWLCNNLPNDIWCDVAFIGDRPVAGLGHMRVNGRVDSSFYLCSDPDFQDTQALSLLICDVITLSKSRGFRVFDFGTSSVNMLARGNIFRFKESFGALGSFRNTYTMTLR
jgi:hypothetical protein